MKSFKEFSFKKIRTTTPVQQSKPEDMAGGTQQNTAPAKRFANVRNVFKARKPAHSEKVSKVSKVSSLEGKKAYLDDKGRLRIPLDADDKYRYWAGGQSVFATLLELGASDKEIESCIGPIHNPTAWKRWQRIKNRPRKKPANFSLQIK
ncbi:hypothetical protein GKODMF_08485 [Candidatus Electrothrix gigas]